MNVQAAKDFSILMGLVLTMNVTGNNHKLPRLTDAQDAKIETVRLEDAPGGEAFIDAILVPLYHEYLSKVLARADELMGADSDETTEATEKAAEIN